MVIPTPSIATFDRPAIYHRPNNGVDRGESIEITYADGTDAGFDD